VFSVHNYFFYHILYVSTCLAEPGAKRTRRKQQSRLTVVSATLGKRRGKGWLNTPSLPPSHHGSSGNKNQSQWGGFKNFLAKREEKFLEYHLL